MLDTFIYVIGIAVVIAVLYGAYELYLIRQHLDGHNAQVRRTVTRRRLSPELFDQETQ